MKDWRLPSQVGPLALILASLGVMGLTATVVQSCRGPSPAASPGTGTAFSSGRQAVESLGGAGAEGAAAVDGGALATDVRYTVQSGDTLSGIAARFGVPQDVLASQNHLVSADDLAAGDVLLINLAPSGEGPESRILPDAAFVYGPACAEFDVISYLAGQPGRLTAFSELVDSVPMTGPAMIDRVARDFSICPKVLLAFIESRSGWVSRMDQAGSGLEYPAGLVDPMRSGLWRQLQWLADRLNGGYYDLKSRGNRLLSFADGVRWSGHRRVDAGSFAIQRALALQSGSEELVSRQDAFGAVYRSMFGDPYEAVSRASARTAGDWLSLKPGGPAFPALTLPWVKGETWWLTGGPHGAWADGSAWAALDFVADEAPLGCQPSERWATAVADGVVADNGPHPGDGQLYLDLDGDGRRQTGPVVFYMHLAAEGRAEVGATVKAGDPLGHPSCEGGASNATHLHIARMLDGEWIAAGDAGRPFTLGHWQAAGANRSYDGTLSGRLGAKREACECRREGVNDVRW